MVYIALDIDNLSAILTSAPAALRAHYYVFNAAALNLSQVVLARVIVGKTIVITAPLQITFIISTVDLSPMVLWDFAKATAITTMNVQPI